MTAVRSKLNRTAVVALAVTLSGWAQASRGDDDSLKYPTISVSGTGRISAKPDIAEVTAGVVTHAPTAKDALAANNESMSRLLQVLKEHGIAEKDIQTSQIQISPQYSQPQPRPYNPQGAPVAPGDSQPGEFVPRIVGYKVDNSVRVISRRIDHLGPVLDAIVQAGANQISGISFRVEHAERLLDEARKRAVADAKHKGELLAGEAGVVLGPPLKIAEQDGLVPGPARFFGAAMAAPMAVAPGEQELAVTISLIYELKTPK
jgi:uncharacterized protein